MKKIFSLLLVVVSILVLTGCSKKLECDYSEKTEGYEYKEEIEFYYDSKSGVLEKLALIVEIALEEDSYTKDDVKTFLDGAKKECEESYKIEGFSCKVVSSGFDIEQTVTVTLDKVDEDVLYEMLSIDKNNPETYDEQKKALVETGYTCK